MMLIHSYCLISLLIVFSFTICPSHLFLAFFLLKKRDSLVYIISHNMDFVHYICGFFSMIFYPSYFLYMVMRSGGAIRFKFHSLATLHGGTRSTIWLSLFIMIETTSDHCLTVISINLAGKCKVVVPFLTFFSLL